MKFLELQKLVQDKEKSFYHKFIIPFSHKIIAMKNPFEFHAILWIQFRTKAAIQDTCLL